MTDGTDIEELKKRWICSGCVDDSFLKNEIATTGSKGKCHYCGKIGKCFSIEEMSERVENAFAEHFQRTSDQPDSLEITMLSDKESDYDWERHGEEVIYAIMNAAEIPEEAASDIQHVLEDRFSDFDAAKVGEETEFASDSYYEEKGTDVALWQDEWHSFERSLKTEARFFSRTSAEFLNTIFKEIDGMQTRDGRSMIASAGPGTPFASLYRARVFQTDDKLKETLMRPDRGIGPPPSVDAHAGRMNARGISVFYGANTPEVALAEIRPPVGSQVALARFDIIRPIYLLDLTALSEVATTGSVFDPTFIGRLERAMFLRNLSKRITIPVMPDDEQLEYLPTQAIADFLATESSPALDGIIFPSVQVAGAALNVVLFHKAARVEELDIPRGTELSARLGQMYEEGWEREYTVIEETPSKEDAAKPASQSFPFNLSQIPFEVEEPDWEVRPVTLRIDTDSLKVHLVQAVSFVTNDHKVYRHRWEKRRLEDLI